MAFQFPLLFTPVITLVTAEGLQVRVCQDMSLEACGQISCVFAVKAAVGFLTGVNQHVSFQSATLRKFLFTLSTSKLFLLTVEIDVSL